MLGCHVLVAYGFASDRPTVVAVALLSLFFWWNMSWAGLMWTVLAEVLPDAVRAGAMGMAIVVFWLSTFVSTQFIETLLDALSPQATFGLFALGCVGALAFVQCCLPETKGALHGHGAHAPAAHAPRPPTRRALMDDFYQGAGVARHLSRERSEADSDEAEFSAAVGSSKATRLL